MHQLDHDLSLLGLSNRSEAIREGLRLLHEQAEQIEMARSYDAFYGEREAPLSDISAIGDVIAAEAISEHEFRR